MGRDLRSFLGTAATLIVVLLLAGTTPFGTGVGVHRGELLHLALPHTHPGQTAVVDAPILDPDLVHAAGEPTVGAATAAAVALAVLSVAPGAPLSLLLPTSARRTVRAADGHAPRGRLEAPASPPPRLAA